jgi:hypothetical protein
MQLGSIELLYVNAQPLHKIKIIKRTPRRTIMQSVLAFAQQWKKVLSLTYVDPQSFGSNLLDWRYNQLGQNEMQDLENDYDKKTLVT